MCANILSIFAQARNQASNHDVLCRFYLLNRIDYTNRLSLYKMSFRIENDSFLSLDYSFRCSITQTHIFQQVSDVLDKILLVKISRN